MMKKFFILLVIGLVSVAAWSCSDDDDDKDTPITVADLPKAAQDFLTQYYPGDKVVSVMRDTDKQRVEYDVKLASGSEVDFDATGDWIDVDAPAGAGVPEGIIPPAIKNYMDTTFPEYLVNEISKRADGGYEVELTNGMDLRFDKDGNFVGHLS